MPALKKKEQNKKSFVYFKPFQPSFKITKFLEESIAMEQIRNSVDEDTYGYLPFRISFR